MSEVTRVVTVQITSIAKGDELKHLREKEEVRTLAPSVIGKVLDADDIVVTNVQDFVME